MIPYPYPRPYRQEPNGPYIVQTGKGIRTFDDPEMAWSAYYFSKLQYEKEHEQDN